MAYGVEFPVLKTTGGPHSCHLAVSAALVSLYDCRGRGNTVGKTAGGSWELG